MLLSEAPIPEIPEPANVIFEVDPKTKTLSGFPADLHSANKFLITSKSSDKW